MLLSPAVPVKVSWRPAPSQGSSPELGVGLGHPWDEGGADFAASGGAVLAGDEQASEWGQALKLHSGE